MTPLKAIRAKCMDCSCYQMSEVKNCIITDCPLWPYRMGRMLTKKELEQYTGPGTPSSKSQAKSQAMKELYQNGLSKSKL